MKLNKTLNNMIATMGALLMIASTVFADDWREDWHEDPSWGGRIGYVDGTGTLWVNLHYQSIDWVDVATSVQDFQLLDWRLCVLKNDGTLLLGEKRLNEPLTAIDSDVSAFQLTLSSIGILRNNGDFRIAYPGYEPETVADNVVAFHVMDNRIAILKDDNSLWMYQGGVVDEWTHIADNVLNFQLEREYVAYVQETSPGNNVLVVARGDIWDGLQFTEMAEDVTDFHMEVTVEASEGFPSRMHLAVADLNGNLYAAENDDPGQMNLQKIPLNAIVTKVEWAGRRLAVRDALGNLQVSDIDYEGNFGDWTNGNAIQTYRMNSEHTLLVSRQPRELRMIRGLAKLIEDSGVLEIGGFDWASEELVADGAELFGLSSIRPDYSRRPVFLGSDIQPEPDPKPGPDEKGKGKDK